MSPSPLNPSSPPQTAYPRPGTIRDQWGDWCSQTTVDDYPLTAKCENCGVPIRCSEVARPWLHKYSRLAECDAR